MKWFLIKPGNRVVKCEEQYATDVKIHYNGRIIYEADSLQEIVKLLQASIEEQHKDVRFISAQRRDEN